MPRPATNMTLDDLPMFATDAEIARAIVGPERAAQWREERLPALAAKPGFPPIDPFHGGRPVALVKRFYDEYLCLTGNGQAAQAGREGTWNLKRNRAG